MKTSKMQKDSAISGTSFIQHCTENQTAGPLTAEDCAAKARTGAIQETETRDCTAEARTGAIQETETRDCTAEIRTEAIQETETRTTENRKTADQTGTAQSTTGQIAVKKLSEMNLLDNFLFGSVVTYPEIGEKFVSLLLKTILGREVKHLSVTAQKVFYGADSDLHGARLDVYLEPEIEEGVEGNAAVYDIEPESVNKASGRKALPRRTRFYHGKIAARSLKSGEDYEALKNAVVIMIMPFDPFGLGRMSYTIKNRCVEVPEMEYEDGASTIFLYTKGTVGIPGETVKQMLHYMEETTYENAVNEDLREIHRMVDTVKKDQKVARMRMKMVEDIIRQREKIAELEGEKAKQTEEIAKQAEEIRKLQEELKRWKEREGME